MIDRALAAILTGLVVATVILLWTGPQNRPETARVIAVAPVAVFTGTEPTPEPPAPDAQEPEVARAPAEPLTSTDARPTAHEPPVVVTAAREAPPLPGPWVPPLTGPQSAYPLPGTPYYECWDEWGNPTPWDRPTCWPNTAGHPPENPTPIGTPPRLPR